MPRNAYLCLRHLALAPHSLSLPVALLLALLGGAHALAAEPLPAQAAAPAMTLAQAIDYARQHQPRIRSAMARLAARKSEARIPRAQWLPQVGVTAQLIYGTANNTTASYLNVPEVDLPRIGGSPAVTGLDLEPHASTLAAVGVSQELFDFGRIAAQSTAADALVEEARAQAELSGLEVQISVEEAYDAVLAARSVLAAAQDAEKRAQTNRDYAQAGVRTGMRPPVDLSRARADLAAAEVRRVRAETSLVQARNTLAAAIGSAQPEIDAAPGDTSRPSTSPGLDEALRIANQKNPLIVSSIARLRAQEATTKAIGRQLLPNLSLTAALSGRAGGQVSSTGDTPFADGWLPDVLNWHAGVVLQWNIFDATVLARRSASKAREEQARADLDTARIDTMLAVERAYLDLQAALRTIPGLTEAEIAAKANQAQAEARFKAGLGTALELAEAELLLTRSQVELAVGRFGVDRARAQLGRAIGAAVP